MLYRGISNIDYVFTSSCIRCCSCTHCHLKIYSLLKADIMVHEYIIVTGWYTTTHVYYDEMRGGCIVIYATVYVGLFACSIENKAASDQVLQAVEKALQTSPFSYQGARILSGQEEGAFGWVTVNYLDDRLTQVSWCCCSQKGSKSLSGRNYLLCLCIWVGKDSQSRDSTQQC